MQYNFSAFKEDLKKSEERLSKEYLGLHSGRATPVVLDGVMVDSYGSKMPVKNSASISIEDAKTLRVAPWDQSLIKEIEHAIQAANLGLSVATDEAGLRVIFPSLTTESRQKMVKIVKERLEEARIGVRKIREGVWDDIQQKERDGAMSEDDKFRAKEELQKVVDEANARLEGLYTKKEKEILES